MRRNLSESVVSTHDFLHELSVPKRTLNCKPFPWQAYLRGEGVFRFRFRLPTAMVLLVLCRARLYEEAELQLNSQRFEHCCVCRRAAKGPLTLLWTMRRKSKLESDLCLRS